jgi:hypothetical protein
VLFDESDHNAPQRLIKARAVACCLGKSQPAHDFNATPDYYLGTIHSSSNGNLCITLERHGEAIHQHQVKLAKEIDRKMQASSISPLSNSLTHSTWCWWICLTGA